MPINALVLKTLDEAGKPLRSADIATAAGINKADVDKAIKQLKKDEKIYSPKACFYDVKR